MNKEWNNYEQCGRDVRREIGGGIWVRNHTTAWTIVLIIVVIINSLNYVQIIILYVFLPLYPIEKKEVLYYLNQIKIIFIQKY